VAEKGWNVTFSKAFFENSTENTKRNVIGDRMTNSQINTPRKLSDDIEKKDYNGRKS
jgi:hypothetical protein